MAAIVCEHGPCAGTDAAVVTGFSAEWLSLREPADSRARDVGLTARFVEIAHSRRRFVDLACGTGANFRYLGPRVGGDWRLVDSDTTLLARVGAVDGCETQTQVLDLATGLPQLDLGPQVMVTASALLDLVSDRWLVQLVGLCSASRCAALFALSYDGRIALTPSDPDDEWIRQLVNRHQLGDKGFGAALGPGAWRRTAELFREAGYQVLTARSDWNLQADESLLQQSLLDGWAGAAMELASKDEDRCRDWLARRLAHVGSGASCISVGHEDLLALPRG